MPLSTINSNSFSTTANTNIDNGNLFIDAINNRIGMGTTTPVATHHIKGSGTSGQTTSALILENASSGTLGLDITGTAGSSYARLRYGGGPGTGTNSMTGDVALIGLEGSSIGFQQIKFAPTQVASSDANTLDDYEEGTWTPTYSSGTIAGATGTYTKIGRLVAASFQVQWTQSGTTFGYIGGLPFNVATINYLSTHSREWYSTGLSVQCYTSIGSALMYLIFYNNSVAVTNGSIYGVSGTLVYHI